MRPYLIIKRIFDFVFALFLIIVALPIMLVAAISIKVETKGSILFVQRRPGKNTKIFKIWKFRTMITDQERNGRMLSDMERLTMVGAFLRKTSIDELPQLFNILKGEMSFIGPRPLLVQYLEHYSPEQVRRHEVLPGISGWAQVNGRNNISWEKKFEYDVYYVNNISFRLDLKVLWLTICKVVSRKDINQSNLDTMEDFMGTRSLKTN